MSSILLNGRDLTMSQFLKITKEQHPIMISAEAMARVAASHRLIQERLAQEDAIYGLTRGVGGNKDQQVTNEQMLEYNQNLIYAHCVSIPPEASEDVVRSMLLVRLNTMLIGHTGVQVEVVRMYQDFLNHQIHPVVFTRGSIGEGDITSLGFIGLAMMREGEVIYQGKRMPASEALQKAQLQPVTMGPKAGLSIVSSNAFSTGKGILILDQAKEFLSLANAIYSLSFDAFYGQPSILHPLIQKTSKSPGLKEMILQIETQLDGSDLWDQKAKHRLQDPLCFRSAPHVHGSVYETTQYLERLLTNQLNTSDDNPSVFVDQQCVLPTANFEITHGVLVFEMLTNALSHLARLSCMRMLKFGQPAMTGSTHFLSPQPGVIHAFGALQKTFIALDAEIRHAALPSSNDFLSIANGMEDHSTHAPLVLSKLEKTIENLYYIFSMEAMHAAQLIDFQQDRRLGKGTQNMYDQVRSVVPVLKTDRVLSTDIQNLYYYFRGIHDRMTS